ncbi:MAG: type II toxin-antitoxin system VapC family toxin [Ardenticatenaceae bacterium]|nr:type II toxin-antitoxin system VapC family toxin [Anaerolineales bacterium]MCB8937724.1 type II toxin-antitoxin system VapC family toxin [Ardenticatenaceae bacterium]MCB8974293.1 type II toxin-antitoxin system VapC family toxin [Ardenticatenaceae bacterium]
MTTFKVYCPDASLIIRFLLNRGDADAPIVSLWRDWFQANHQLIVPSLFFYEVSNALFQYVRHGRMEAQTVLGAMQEVNRFNLQVYRDDLLHRRAVELANQLGLPATYDAHYLALSERMGAQFWTLDEKLVNKVKSQLSWVNLFTN